MGFHALQTEIRQCQICSTRFAGTKTAHSPRPVVWFQPDARLLIAGQAPGLQVHQSGTPFLDRSGDRLRMWMGVDADTFYDLSQVAIVPMAFCFPGYSTSNSDLPPPNVCAETWRTRVLAALPNVRLTLLIGGYAQSWHLGKAASGGVTKTVQAWKSFLPDALPLPHPSWRNNAWLKANPWFEADLLPVLRQRVAEVLA